MEDAGEIVVAQGGGMKLLSSVVKNNRVKIGTQRKIIFNVPNSQSSKNNEVNNHKQNMDIIHRELIQKSKQQAKDIITEAKETAEQIKLKHR